MGVRIIKVLMGQEFQDLNEKAKAEGFYHADRRVFAPGTAWLMPWYYNPSGESKGRLGRGDEYSMYSHEDREAYLGGKDVGHGLSIHYWRDWSHIRPPICVMCPNGEQWEMDRVASNGTGWIVTGELPNITCSPSIVVPGYHGYLRNGEFTDDIEGRGPNGVAR